MTTNHEAVAALPATGSANHTLIRDLLVRRMAYVVSAASEVPNLVAVDPASGAAIIDIVCLGRSYLYDSTDTTTAHDGTTCLVSSEGHRYKLATGTDIVAYSILDADLTTPPGSPAIGNAYLVAATGTGAWAGHTGDVAVYTSRGWEFVTFAHGRLLYVEDIDGYLHRNSSGSWVSGFGGQALAASTVPVSALIGQPVRWIVENQTTNTPPTTATVGTNYIIGSSPTGSWSGSAGKIAACEVANTFTLYTPRTGELAYNKALDRDVRYSGTSWSAGVDAYVLIDSQSAAASSTIDFVIGLDDTYDSFEIVLTNVKSSANDVALQLQIGTGAGPTYQTGSVYRYAAFAVDDTPASGAVGGFNQTSITLVTNGSSTGLGNTAGYSLEGRVNFSNPEVTTDFVNFNWHVGYVRANGRQAQISGSGRYQTVGAITGIRLSPGSGNFASGRFALYGRRK